MDTTVAQLLPCSRKTRLVQKVEISRLLSQTGLGSRELIAFGRIGLARGEQQLTKEVVNPVYRELLISSVNTYVTKCAMNIY